MSGIPLQTDLLRQCADRLTFSVTTGHDWPSILRQAADEIDRLREVMVARTKRMNEALDEIDRLRVELAATVLNERERCIAACVAVMNSYGGDPTGHLLSSERVRMQHQLQAMGAAQCVDAVRRGERR